ncbi:MAG: type II toxin-antitoxin system VapC family toxin [Candidatus Kapabacteria bacterium]|nr:type II toxin-antitoxin system VapC family toxin [Candidatus Kapabacteria bacterium]
MDESIGTGRILIDTSILINYYREKNIEKTMFYQLTSVYDFSISIITEFEFLVGFNDEKLDFAKEIIKEMQIFNINKDISEIARRLYIKLKKINKMIPFTDLFIAATAVYHQLPLATLNKKHFENIEEIILI